MENEIERFNGFLNSFLIFCLLFYLGVFGKGKCGCPCRDYFVPKCEITYEQQCYYEHYEQVSYF